MKFEVEDLDPAIEDIKLEYDPGLCLHNMVDDGQYLLNHLHTFSRKDQARIKLAVSYLTEVCRAR